MDTSKTDTMALVGNPLKKPVMSLDILIKSTKSTKTMLSLFCMDLFYYSIFPYLDFKSLQKFSRCNKECDKLCSKQSLWKNNRLSIGIIFDEIRYQIAFKQKQFEEQLCTSLLSFPKKGVFVLNRDKTKYEQLVRIFENRNKLIVEINRINQWIQQYKIDNPVLQDFLKLFPDLYNEYINNCEETLCQNQNQLTELKIQLIIFNNEIKSTIKLKQESIADNHRDYEGPDDHIGVTHEEYLYNMEIDRRYNTDKCIWCRDVGCFDSKCAEKVFEAKDSRELIEVEAKDFDIAFQFIKDAKL